MNRYPIRRAAKKIWFFSTIFTIIGASLLSGRSALAAPVLVTDDFSSGNYSGGSGWPSGSSWTEVNDNNDSSSGSIRLNANTLQLEGSSSGPMRSITRAVDLTGATSASLAFDWTCSGTMEAAEEFFFAEYSADGGSNWQLLQQKEGAVDMCPGGSSGSESGLDMAGALDADPSNTVIRFRFTFDNSGEDMFIDNVVLTYETAVAGEISGVVFRDYDADGAREQFEPGLAGVTVLAVDETGATATVVTGSDGSYTVTGLSGQVRLEFIPTAAQQGFLFPGKAGETSVAFADATSGVSGLNVGFNNPAQYFDAGLDLTTNYYVNGEAANISGGPNQAVVSWPYNRRGDAVAPTTISEQEDAGTTWGLAYNRVNETLYASAFLKRHSGLQQGPGAIFAIDPASPANGSLFVDLTAAPFSLDFGEPGTDAARGLPSSRTGLNTDPQAFFTVGKFGIGDLDISEDNETLWFVNLYDKTLYSLEIDSDDNPSTAPGLADLNSYPLPTNQCNSYTTLYINGGGTQHGSLVDSNWAGDGYYVSGTTATVGGGTNQYATKRSAASFQYIVPVPDGSYDVTLYIRDGSTNAFDITIEGSTSAVNAAANTNFSETRTVSVTDGVMNFQFDNATSGTPTINGIEIAAAGSQTFSEAQPFGIKVHDGTVNVGLVCTAEYSQDATDLDAYVYRLSSETLPFTQLATFALDYSTKGAASSISGCDGSTSLWHPWATSLPGVCTGSTRTVWPQPIFSGLEFDIDDSLVVAFVDRLGHQLGNFNRNLTDSGNREGVIGGDILRLDNNAGTYTLESNGSSGSLTANWLTSDNGVANGEGPGNGEFFQDDADPPRSHQELIVGGVLHRFGEGEFASTAMDPLGDATSGGVMFFDALTGGSTTSSSQQDFDGYEVYQSSSVATFGKSNGIGDLEAISDLAPVELGNRIWQDSNGDGVQDPGEPGLAGVTVELWADTDDNGSVDAKVAETTTDANGRYLFSTSGTNSYGQSEDWSFTAANDVNPETAYEVRIDTTQAVFTSGNLTVTAPNAPQPAGGNASVSDNNPFTDLADSDAVVNGSTAVIAYTTGPGGANNHTLDVGFSTTDQGDLPDTFDTTLAANGPAHTVTSSLYLGSCIDADGDGQPDNEAGTDGSGGDDSNTGVGTQGTCATAGDDEDGITLITPLVAGSEACVSVTAVNSTGFAASLYGFIDYNGDGDFDGDTDDRLTGGTNGTPFSGGLADVPDGGVTDATYCFDVPTGATFDGGETHLRFRLTSDTLSGNVWAGAATDGEVEDYYTPLACVGNYLWLDTGSTADEQDGGDTAVADGTAVNLIWGGPDGSIGGGDDVTYTTTTASGVYSFCGLLPDANGDSTDDQYRVTVPINPGALVTADQGGDDALDSDGTASGSATNGPIFTVAIPNSVTDNAGNDTDPNGYPDNRTDLTFDFGYLASDLGDLPDTFGTLIASGGPTHAIVNDLYLGSCVDGETDGQPNGIAGIDGNGGDDSGSGIITRGTCIDNDDEDGVVLADPLIPGAESCVSVAAVNSTAGSATLQGWIDFNGSGTFEPGEELNSGDFAGGGVTVANGGPFNQEVCFTVPATATFDGGETHMRFRLSSAGSLGTGGAAADGEVEDYFAPLTCVGNYVWADGDANGQQNEAGSAGINGVTVELVWSGEDADFQQTADNKTYAVATAADGGVNGKYQFCGLIPGDYRIDIPTAPASFGFATGPNVGGDDQQDSDGVQPGGFNGPVSSPVFSIALPSYGGGPFYGLPTGESGTGDTPGALDNFPDSSDDLTFDFGFVNSASQDWGDLPDSFGTTAASSGAVHDVTGPYLGDCVDRETSGYPTSAADGEDAAASAPTGTTGTCATSNDDEDGVTAAGNWSDGTGDLTIVASADACLNVWLDFTDGAAAGSDGDFGDTLSAIDEWVVENQAVTAGSNAISFSLPAGVANSASFYLRARLTDRDSGGGCGGAEAYGGTAASTGPASSGEVEDYQFAFNPTSVKLSQAAASATTDSSWWVLLTFALLLTTASMLGVKRLVKSEVVSTKK